MTSTRKLAAVLALLFLISGGGWAVSLAAGTPTFDSYCAAEKSAADTARATQDRLYEEWNSTSIWKDRVIDGRNPRYDELHAEYNAAKEKFKDAAEKSGECWNRWNSVKGESAARGGLAGSLAFLAVPLLVFAFWHQISGAASRARATAEVRGAELKAAAEVKKAERKAEAEVRRVEREAAAEQRRAEAAQRLADAQARAAAQPAPVFAGQGYPAAPTYQAPPTTPVYEYPENAPAANPAYAQQEPVQAFSSPAPQQTSASAEDDWLDVD
ncbi:MAG: hypothetical protein KDB26_05705 [Microthrixaceae bacterium]|nr:hypothetical protein [Microthrixaceae bacterium]